MEAINPRAAAKERLQCSLEDDHFPSSYGSRGAA
jgi:hypothetical protein